MTQPRESSRWRRLVISLADLAAARESAGCLLELDEFGAAPHEMSSDFKAHLKRFVIAYARPFTWHQSPELADRTLDGVTHDFTEEEEELHDRLCDLRDEEVAHSDPGPAGVSIYIVDEETKGSISRVTRLSALRRAHMERAQGMLQKLERAVWAARRRIEGQVGGA